MTNKIALITGSNRGLGKSAALHLAKRHVDVVVTFRSNREEAEAVVAEIKSLGANATALQLDVGKVSTFDAFATELKAALTTTFKRSTIDFLVNNGGNAVNSTFAETTEAQFDEMMNVHFKGVFFLTQKLLPLIENGGRILNISSGLARFTSPGRSVYGSMKGGLEVLSRYLAKELGPRKIAVNVLAPGPIATDFGGGAVRDNTQLNQMLSAQTALGRVGVADDIGPLVASLLGEESRWINGQRIEAAGGINL